MKFGAHEVIELADMLREKVQVIQHFAFYEQEAQEDALKSMIKRQLDAMIQGYDTWVATIHDTSAKHRMTTPMPQPEAHVERIKLGLRQTQPITPQTSGKLNDAAIAQALLFWHKTSATHCIERGLEMADPQLRQLFVNAAITCFNQAYETFLFLNQRGMYQMPTFEPQTTQAELGAFLPVHNQSQFYKAQQQTPVYR
ncbi:MAG: spore coat protein [Paenibacillaceae bacterium]|nr:spore coat protein [Paenibacillaceae bacterium]